VVGGNLLKRGRYMLRV